MTETVVDHVRLWRELRMRAVTDELSDRKAALSDVFVEDAVGQRTFRRDEVHVGLVLDAPAQMTELRDLALRDGQLALGVQVGLAGVLDMQLVELRADIAPDPRFLRRVFDDRWAQPFETMTPAQREQLAAPGDVPFIAKTRMTGLELELGRLRLASPSTGDRSERRTRSASALLSCVPRVAFRMSSPCIYLFQRRLQIADRSAAIQWRGVAGGSRVAFFRTPPPARLRAHRRLLERGIRVRVPHWPDAARDPCRTWLTRRGGGAYTPTPARQSQGPTPEGATSR